MNIQEISSLKNQVIKKVQALNKKRGRTLHNQFVFEGIRELELALDSEVEIEAVIFNSRWDISVLEQFASRLDGVKLYCADNEVFDKVSYRDSVPNCLTISTLVNQNLEGLSSFLKPNSLVLVLESIEKPGNIGAMFRTADAAGIDAIIISNPDTDMFNPNVIRASLGSFFTVPFAIAENQETLDLLKAQNFNIYSTYLEGSIPHFDVDMKSSSTAIVMGSEAQGISSFWIEKSDQFVKIPMRGKVDSMNVSTAAAVMIYEAVRQRS